MKVLVIPSWYPNGTDKLMGIYHQEFCKALARQKDIEVDMLYIDRQRLKSPLKYLFMKKEEVIEETGYRTYTRKILDISKLSFDLQMKHYVKNLEKAFIKYCKENKKPDILHAEVSIPAGYATCVLGEKYHIPVVITEHASYFERFFKNNKKYMDYCKKHAYFTTVSKYMKEIVEKYTKSCDVLPNLVDTTSFKKERKKIKGMRLISVAALRQGKRVDDIIAALKIIREEEKIKDAKLTIVGDGFLEEYYKKKCLELGMDDYVDFVGRKTKEEIVELLQNANIFVIASDKETFCIPGIEALASGIPIVSTKCLGPEEYINKDSGELVEVGNKSQMAKAIVKVYKNLENYEIEKLRKIADQYSSDAVTKKAIEIYKNLLK